MKRVVDSVAVAALMAMMAACSADPAAENPRTAEFKAIAKANKAIGEELKKDAPSIEAIAPHAALLDSQAKKLPGWFTGTSGPEPGIETEARPEIWQKPAEFRAASDRFAAATAALQTAIASGDAAQVKAAAALVPPTCKGCHDPFRLKK